MSLIFPSEATEGQVLREIWRDVQGKSISDVDFTSPPDEVEYLSSFEGPTDDGLRYATRLTALVTAPEDGDYEFFVSGDEEAVLYISNSGTLEGLTEAARVDGWSQPRDWHRSPTQTTGHMDLLEGQVLLIQVLHKEYRFSDHCAVGWSINGSEVTVIEGMYCARYLRAVPSMPAPRLTHVSDSAIRLSWTPPSDGFGIAYYKVHRWANSLPDTGGVEFSVMATAFSEQLTPGTVATYRLSAVTHEGVESAPSPSLVVNVPRDGPSSGLGSGLSGSYYEDLDFSDLLFEREDSVINFPDDTSFPSEVAVKNDCSIRWLGQIELRYSGDWTFYISSDDSVRLWVDNQLVVDDWKRHRTREASGTIALEAGKKYDLRLEYRQHGANANLVLNWEHLSQARQLIPQSQLYLDPVPNTPRPQLTTGTESYTSPAYIEFRSTTPSSQITLSSAGSALDFFQLNSSYYYTDVSLNRGGVTNLTWQFGAATETDEISWKPITIGGGVSKLTIRKGDSLLLTAVGEAGDAVEIYSLGGGSALHTGVLPEAFVETFSSAGSYSFEARVAGETVGSLNVSVVEVDFLGPTACEVMFERTKVIDVRGAEPNAISLQMADWNTGTVRRDPALNDGMNYLLRPASEVLSPLLIARIGSNGPVIAQHTVQQFTLHSTANDGYDFVELTDEEQISYATLQLNPHVSGLDVVLKAAASSVTFLDSTSQMDLSTDQFTRQIRHFSFMGYGLIGVREKDAERYPPCHSITILQDGVLIGY